MCGISCIVGPGSTSSGLWRSLVSASGWGPEGRVFESRQPDVVARRSAARLARLVWVQEDVSSNLTVSTEGRNPRHG